MNSIVPPLVLGGAIAGGAIAGGIAGGIILSSPIFQMKTLVPTLAPSIMVPAPPPDLVDFDPTTTVRTGAKTTFLIDSTLFPTRSEVDGIMDQLNFFFTDIITNSEAEERKTIARDFPGFQKLKATWTDYSTSPNGNTLITEISYIVDLKFEAGSDLNVKDRIDAELEGADSNDFTTNYVPNALPVGTVFAQTRRIVTNSGLGFPTSAPSESPVFPPTKPTETTAPTTIGATTAPTQVSVSQTQVTSAATIAPTQQTTAPTTVPATMAPTHQTTAPSTVPATTEPTQQSATPTQQITSAATTVTSAPTPPFEPIMNRATLTFVKLVSERTPTEAEIDGIMEQLNIFYSDVLRATFANFDSFVATDLGTVSELRDGIVVTRIAYDGETNFVRGPGAPPMEAVEAVIEAADLDEFKNKYIPNASPVGSSIFTTTASVSTSNGTNAPTPMTDTGTQAPTVQPDPFLSQISDRYSSEMQPRPNIFRHSPVVATVDVGSRKI